MPVLPSGTVTLVFTDIEGSTRLLHELGDAYAEVLAEHRRLLREAFQSHGGVEVDTQGDAFFYAFSGAKDALLAAEQAQAVLAAGPVRVRVGIHTGEPLRTDEGYVGVDVHRAARVMAAGHGGQTLVSEATRKLVDERFPLRDLGPQRLKDMTAPERLYQLGDGEFPPLKTLKQTNLPIAASALVGRERELAELLELLRAGHRIVTITGAGGSGKTRLALQAAAEVVESFRDGVFWVPLAAVADPELVLPTIAQTLGVKHELATYLAGRESLLLLDNFEHVLPAAEALSALAATPHVRVLVTSRSRLQIGGEREYVLDPLADEEAVALFFDRSPAVGRTPSTDSAVREICRRLDRLPLAIELAAARTKLLAPEALLARLGQRLPLLTGGRRDVPERQRTLRATIAWSYDLLDAQAGELFARLAVFAGGFSLEAAEQVGESDLDCLATLVDLSLLKPIGDGRFLMLETIREFAAGRLEETAEAQELRRRHAEYFIALARSANLTQEAEGEMRHDIVIRERDDVRGALEWALRSGEIELGLRLAVALENYWVTDSPREGKRWVGELLERAEDLPDDLRAHALRTYGNTAVILGELEEGTRHYELSLAEYRRLGDRRGIAIMLQRVAFRELGRGDAERARALGEDSLRISREIGFKKGEAGALAVVAELELREGNDAAAFELLERSAALAAESGFSWWRAGVLLDMSELLLERGRGLEANARLREALLLVKRMGDRRRMIYALALLARLAAETGYVERAGRLWGAVEAEDARAPVGAWEGERETHAERVLAHAGADFERGRRDGRQLSLGEAVDEALAADADSV